FCTPKGRALANFQLARRSAESHWLRMRADIVEATAAALGKYAVFSKTQLAPADLIGLGLHGPRAAALVASVAGECPAARHGVAQTADGLVIRRDDAGLRFECWLNAAAAAALWER